MWLSMIRIKGFVIFLHTDARRAWGFPSSWNEPHGRNLRWDLGRPKTGTLTDRNMVHLIFDFLLFVCNYSDHRHRLRSPGNCNTCESTAGQVYRTFTKTPRQEENWPRHPKNRLMDKVKCFSHLYSLRCSFYQGSLPRCPPCSVPLSHFCLKSDETWSRLVLRWPLHFSLK